MTSTKREPFRLSDRGTMTRFESDHAYIAVRDTSRAARVRNVFAFLVMVVAVSSSACKPVTARRAPSATTAAIDSSAETHADSTGRSFTFAHGVRIYVSAVNCEMNAEDAERVNSLSRIPGLTVEVVFTGISGHDTSVVVHAQRDLGLTVPTRMVRDHELAPYTSIGGASLPMALMIKGRQLKTIVSGETMPRTLSIVEASLASIAPLPSNTNHSPEG
ncbi:MAG: hypothetical protein ABJB74_23140 [Gemmatimonas sp.]